MSSTPSKRSTTSASKTTTTTYVPVDTSESKKREHITPTTQPIARPLTSVGRTYSHIHPVLLLLHFTQRFSSIVAAPIPSLLRDLAVLGIAQGAYCVICLPPTSAPTRASLRTSDGEKEKNAKKAAAPRGKKKEEVGMGSRASV